MPIWNLHKDQKATEVVEGTITTSGTSAVYGSWVTLSSNTKRNTNRINITLVPTPTYPNSEPYSVNIAISNAGISRQTIISGLQFQFKYPHETLVFDLPIEVPAGVTLEAQIGSPTTDVSSFTIICKLFGKTMNTTSGFSSLESFGVWNSGNRGYQLTPTTSSGVLTAYTSYFATTKDYKGIGYSFFPNGVTSGTYTNFLINVATGTPTGTPTDTLYHEGYISPKYMVQTTPSTWKFVTRMIPTNTEISAAWGVWDTKGSHSRTGYIVFYLLR